MGIVDICDCWIYYHQVVSVVFVQLRNELPSLVKGESVWIQS
jgi:hypothetical protein